MPKARPDTTVAPASASRCPIRVARSRATAVGRRVPTTAMSGARDSAVRLAQAVEHGWWLLDGPQRVGVLAVERRQDPAAQRCHRARDAGGVVRRSPDGPAQSRSQTAAGGLGQPAIGPAGRARHDRGHGGGGGTVVLEQSTEGHVADAGRGRQGDPGLALVHAAAACSNERSRKAAAAASSSVPTTVRPRRSAMVRATRKVRWTPRAVSSSWCARSWRS